MEPFGNVMLSHLNADFVQNKRNDEFYDCYLDAVGEFQLFTQKKSVPEVIGAVKRNLNSSRARLDGLCMLRRLLTDCSTEMFEQHCISWAGLLLTALQSHDPLVTWQMTCRAMIQLFRQAKLYPELNRELMGSVVPQVVSCLLQTSSERVAVAVRCLSDCLRSYPRTCAPFMNKIENMLTPLLDKTEDTVAEGAAECFSLLGGCGGAGSEGVRHTELWSDLSDRVLGSLHISLNSLYDSLPHQVVAADIRRHDTKTELRLRTVSSSHSDCCYVLLHRFRILTRLLGHMLREEFMSVVKLPVKEILHVIWRVLAVTPKMLVKSVSKEVVTLAAILPSLHVSALTLLTALVECAADVLLPQASVINRLITQSLSWSVSDTGHTRLFGHVRMQVYDTLVTWLQELGTSSDVETISDTLLPHILNDCSPHAAVAMRQEKKDEPKEPVSKKRRKHTEVATNVCTHHQREAHTESGVCLGALHVLHQMIISTGQFMQLKHHKKVHETVVPLLFKVSQQVPEVTLVPYRSAPCRQALYRVLLSCVLVPHPCLPAPMQCALRLLTTGSHDPDIQVASFCREALIICSSIVHPRAPSFYKPVTAETVVMTTRAGMSAIHYANDTVNATSYSGMTNTPEQTVQESHESRRFVNTDVSFHVADVSMTSQGGDALPVSAKPSSTLRDVCNSDSESDIDEEEMLSLTTERHVTMTTEVSMATVTESSVDVSREEMRTEEPQQEAEEKTTDLTTGIVSVSNTQGDVVAMLGSFVDVQPDGPNSP